MTAFFLKAQHSPLTLPAPLPLWLGHGAILFSQSLCNMASQSQEDCGERALRPSWRSSGVGKPHSLCPRNWLAAQPGRCPWLTPESPSSGGLLGILVGLTLNTKHWALLFLPGAQSAAGRGCCLSQCNPNLSVRRVQYLLFWVGEKWKATFGFSVTLVRGSRKALSFPNLNHLTKDIAGPSGQPGYPPAIDP